MSHKFLPYCRYIFLDLDTMLVLGGLDNTDPETGDFFTNYVYNISLVDFNKDDQMYLCKPKSAMKSGRGCFSITMNDGFLYVFGGATGVETIAPSFISGLHTHREFEEKLIVQCEKYDVEND